MSAPTTSLDELNALRRRAVQLRVDGLSLTQIRAATGLSVPTIIRAFDAFKQGGWQGIDVAPRGRPSGLGRKLSPELSERLRLAAFSGHGPEGEPDGLWSRAAVQTMAAGQGVELDARAAARLLERWGLAITPLRARAQGKPALQQWLQSHWDTELQVAQGATAHQRTSLMWAGALSHPALAAPGGLWIALTPRGELHWLASPVMGTQDSAINFLSRLARLHPNRELIVFLHGPDFDRAPQVAEWLAALPHLHVRPCPIAPVMRRAPDAAAAAPVPTPVHTPLQPTPVRELASAISTLARRPRGAASSFVVNPSLQETEPTMSLTHLQRLEAESIHIMREVVAEADNPVMLYSIGKDSAVMLHLARKAFYPSPPPFPLLHVDTTWKFRAMYEMRDRMAKELGMTLLVYQNPEAQEMGVNPFDHGSQIHTDMWKTQGLKQALDKYGFDAAFGGARRDEEKSRAKERIFSFRSAQHRWDPKNQRPELWRLYNGRKQKGESIRVFPISNWTELDIWQYILLENVPIVPLYFAAERPVVERDGTLIMVDDERFPLKNGEVPMMKKVRFRTLGCYPLSGAVESEADSLTAIIQEMLLTKTSERQGRMIDHDTAASMEKKKQEGYF